MKTKRRHELQTNILADWMGKQIETLRPHSQTIALGALGAVAVIAAAIAASQWLSTPDTEGWPEYFGAFADRDAEKLTEVAMADGVDDRAANWALLTAAELQTSEGAQLLYENHEDGAEKLEEAKDTLEQLEKRSPSDTYLKQRSQYVFGQVYESLAAAREKGAAGNIDRARERYEQAKEVNPDTPLGKAAAEALARLKDDKNVVAFMRQFAEHKPPERTDPTGFPPTRSGARADDPPLTDRDLPARPDLTLPGFGLDLGSGKTPAADDPSSAPGESPPAPPSSEPPATDSSTPPTDGEPSPQ